MFELWQVHQWLWGQPSPVSGFDLPRLLKISCGHSALRGKLNDLIKGRLIPLMVESYLSLIGKGRVPCGAPSFRPQQPAVRSVTLWFAFSREAPVGSGAGAPWVCVWGYPTVLGPRSSLLLLTSVLSRSCFYSSRWILFYENLTAWLSWLFPQLCLWLLVFTPETQDSALHNDLMI